MLDKPSLASSPSHLAEAAPLVLLPGTLCDATLYRPVLDRLGRDGTVVALAGAETTAAMARVVLDAAPERFSLCGFSLGAIVALELMAQAPERVERLALIGCNAGLLSPRARAARAAMSREDFIATQVPERARGMALRVDAARFAAQTAMTLQRADSLPRLNRIDVPTLVLCGADDQTCPPDLSRQIAGAVADARLAIVPGAGHYVTLDQPAAVAEALRDWLAIPAFSAISEDHR